MSTEQQMRRHRPLRSNAVLDPDEEVKEVERNGRTYLVFPLIAAREMVLHYPENGTKEYLPAERLQESVQWWAGTPLTFIHPENREKTADNPTAYVENVIGEGHDPEIVNDDKLRVMAWIDVEKAEDLGGLAADVVEMLRAGEELSVSAGYSTLDDSFEGGVFDGEEYDIEQGVLIPDHIAIFPSDQFKARCSPEDGCAAPRANAIVPDDAPTASDSTPMQRVKAPASTSVAPTVTKTTNADGCSPGPCSCGEHVDDEESDNESAVEATATDDDAMTEEITDEHAATLGRRVLNALGVGTDDSSDADASTASPDEPGEDDPSEPSVGDEEAPGSQSEPESDEPEESDVDASESDGDDTPDDEDASTPDVDDEGEEEPESDADSEDTAADDSESSDDTETDTPMPDTLSIEELAAKTAFGVSTLEEWDDEQLAALEATILENNPELKEEAGDDSSETEEETTNGEGDAPDEGEEVTNAETEDDMTTNTEDDDTGQNSEIAELRQELEETKAMVEDVANQRQNAEQERKVRVVANAIDGMTEDAARKLDDDELDALAEKHGQTTTNYQAVPGAVNRDVERPRANAASDEEVEEYPAGGRSAYEARKNGGE